MPKNLTPDSVSSIILLDIINMFKFLGGFPMNTSVGALALLSFLSCGALYGAEVIDQRDAQSEAMEAAFQILRDLQVPFNENTANGHKLLFEAANKGSTEAVQLLLEAGAWNKGLYNGQTALHMAAYQGLGNAVSILLDAGVDVNKGDYFGRTPLLAAVKGAARARNDATMLAIKEKRFDERDPALAQAMSSHVQVIQLLLAAGADKSLADKRKAIPYTIANKNSLYEIMPLLLPETNK